MKGEITLIKKIMDDMDNVRGYELIVETKEKPDLKLGEIKINIVKDGLDK